MELGTMNDHDDSATGGETPAAVSTGSTEEAMMDNSSNFEKVVVAVGETEGDDKAIECSNMMGTTVACLDPAPLCKDDQEGEGHIEEKCEDDSVLEIRSANQHPLLKEEKGRENVSDSQNTDTHPGTMSNRKANSAVQFADDHNEKYRPPTTTSTEISSPDTRKICNIASIKPRGSFSQSQAFSVQTSTTAGASDHSLSNADQPDLEQGEQLVAQTHDDDVEEDDPPLRFFWRDRSTLSSNSSAVVDAETTLVNETVNHLYPPIAVNSYGRPRRLSSSQRKHRSSFAQQIKDVESDTGRDCDLSICGVMEATASSSSSLRTGVMWCCVQSRLGSRLALGALILIVLLVASVIVGMTGESTTKEEHGQGANITAGIMPPVNETLSSPSPILLSNSSSFSPTQAPTIPFDESDFPDILQESDFP